MTTHAPPSTTVGAWLTLEKERRTLEARIKTIASAQEKLRLSILESWSMDGTTQEKVDGLTVHLRRGLHPKIADPARLAIALREEGLTDLLTVDLKAVGVWLEAHDDSGVPLSPKLAALVGEPYERHALAVRLPGRLQ